MSLKLTFQWGSLPRKHWTWPLLCLVLHLLAHLTLLCSSPCPYPPSSKSDVTILSRASTMHKESYFTLSSSVCFRPPHTPDCSPDLLVLSCQHHWNQHRCHLPMCLVMSGLPWELLQVSALQESSFLLGLFLPPVCSAARGVVFC